MWLYLLCALCLASLVSSQNPPDYDWDTPTFLDQYVNSDDGMFQWSTLGIEYQYNGVTIYMLNMTSQRYMDCSYVSCCEWWHIMGVAIPDTITDYDHGFIWIGADSNDSPIPDKSNRFNLIASTLANDTGVVTGYILQVPNQPCVFRDDPDQKQRSEDNMIAWTFRAYFDDPLHDQTPAARLPMTKAVKKGMDTISEFSRSMVPATNITKFGVGGASKRGWTAWSIAATDRRVVSAYPCVFSLLNLDQAMMHHFQAMDGGYSFAMKPYWILNLTHHFFDPNKQGLLDMEDMIRYRSRLTMPKILTLATGDEFFLNQDTLYWWDLMPEPKHILMNPNAEHVLFPHWTDIYKTVAASWLTYLRGEVMPSLTWSLHEDAQSGQINMHTDPPPSLDTDGNYKVRGLRAETLWNNTRRDYRLAGGYPDQSLQPIWWSRQDVTHIGLGNFRYSVDQIEDEWVAHFIEATWDGPDGFPLTLTTQVNIVPDTFPRGPCVLPDECIGHLV